MHLSDTAAARSQLYQLLALGFVHPVVEFHHTLVDGSYSSALKQVATAAHNIDGTIGKSQKQFIDYEADYIHIFQVGKRGQPVVHLNAGDYKELLDSGSRPEFLLEYSGWYRHFGLKTSEEDQANELPDHIVCQIEFLAWLSHLELTATDNLELQRGYQCAQRDFCERHLQPFLELLIIAMKKDKTADHSFFLKLANISLNAVTAMQDQFNKNLGDSVGQLDNPDRIASVNLWG